MTSKSPCQNGGEGTEGRWGGAGLPLPHPYIYIFKLRSHRSHFKFLIFFNSGSKLQYMYSFEQWIIEDFCDLWFCVFLMKKCNKLCRTMRSQQSHLNFRFCQSWLKSSLSIQFWTLNHRGFGRRLDFVFFNEPCNRPGRTMRSHQDHLRHPCLMTSKWLLSRPDF